MANLKFSQFQEQTDPANVQFVVGYNGTDNVRIDPANLGGGGGASSLNDLSDVEIDGTSNYFVNIPAGLSGNPVDNLIIGDTAGDALTTGASNVLLGHDAGLAITTGDYNINIGTEAGRSNTTIDGQVNIGWRAGKTSTNAGDVHIGYKAGEYLNPLIPLSNVIIGYQAASAVGADSWGSVVIGSSAGRSITGGDKIVAIGNQAGQNHTSNSGSVYIGYQAGANANSSNAVVIGANALDALSGSWNSHCVVGEDACTATTSNNEHHAFGFQALRSQTSGQRNSAFGAESLELLTTGADNSAFGHNVGDKVTGDQNTLIGSSAGSSGTNDLTSGDANILIGYNSAASSATVSNEVNLYNGSVTARFQGAAAAWSFVSDARDKKDIEDLELGLDFVNKLKPRKFKWDLRDSDVDKDKEASGFIAQEVKKVLDEMENDYTGIVDTNNPDQYTVSQANIIPMLVKAIQELKAEIELLKSK